MTDPAINETAELEGLAASRATASEARSTQVFHVIAIDPAIVVEVRAHVAVSPVSH